MTARRGKKYKKQFISNIYENFPHNIIAYVIYGMATKLLVYSRLARDRSNELSRRVQFGTGKNNAIKINL